MPHKIAFDESVGCYFAVWAGPVVADEFLEFYRNVAKRPWFRPGLNGLHDFRQADIRANRSDTIRIASYRMMLREMFGPGRAARVVADRGSEKALRSIDVVVSDTDREVEVFTDYEAAKAWLGLPEGYEVPLVNELLGDPEKPSPGSG